MSAYPRPAPVCQLQVNISSGFASPLHPFPTNGGKGHLVWKFSMYDEVRQYEEWGRIYSRCLARVWSSLLPAAAAEGIATRPDSLRARYSYVACVGHCCMHFPYAVCALLFLGPLVLSAAKANDSNDISTTPPRLCIAGGPLGACSLTAYTFCTLVLVSLVPCVRFPSQVYGLLRIPYHAQPRQRVSEYSEKMVYLVFNTIDQQRISPPNAHSLKAHEVTRIPQNTH